MEEFDVVIVGAGLSGIGAAAHLQERFPKRRYVILEARAAIGGTLRETAAERGIDRHIRFGHRVQRAEWSSAGQRWELEVLGDGHAVRIACSFLWMCSGYYSHAQGHRPEFPGGSAARRDRPRAAVPGFHFRVCAARAADAAEAG